jgi:prepilin-type N-terminal cleavage/methylation domain-containing protein
METLRFNRRSRITGFSILEVIIAIAVLSIGLSAMAGLVAQSLSGTERARNMALATTLTSEKLEDLNRWPNSAPQIAAGGSLTADNTTGGLNYFDDIDLSNTTGQVSETIAVTGGYSSTIHKSTGEVIPNSNTAAPSGSGTMAFHRRWLIEADPVVNGITLTGFRRVTVLVTLTTSAGTGAANFQMSMVRP